MLNGIIEEADCYNMSKQLVVDLEEVVAFGLQLVYILDNLEQEGIGLEAWHHNRPAADDNPHNHYSVVVDHTLHRVVHQVVVDID